MSDFLTALIPAFYKQINAWELEGGEDFEKVRETITAAQNGVEYHIEITRTKTLIPADFFCDDCGATIYDGHQFVINDGAGGPSLLFDERPAFCEQCKIKRIS